MNLPSEGCNQRSSEVIRGHQRSSEVIREMPPEREGDAIRGHQRSTEVIRGHHVPDRGRASRRLAVGGREPGRLRTCGEGRVPRRCEHLHARQGPPLTETDEEGRGNQVRSREIVLTKPTRRVASRTPRPSRWRSRWRSRPDSHSHRARRCWAAAYLAPPPPP